ncbi:MAG: phosphoribosyltransferase [Granulosicoccaceae bacterium]
MSEKVFIDAESLLRDSCKLAGQVIRSGFRPNFIVGVWRGGTPVGVAVQEMCDYYGMPSDHISIRTSSYYGVDKANKNVRVHGLSYIIRRANAEDSLLIVDDVYDSGRSIKAIIDELKKKCRKNLPHDIRVATAYYKPERNNTDRAPEYYVHETDAWLVFPHEMSGLDREEVLDSRPWLRDILGEVDGYMQEQGRELPKGSVD